MVFEAKFKDSQNVQKFMEKLLFTFLNIISQAHNILHFFYASSHIYTVMGTLLWEYFTKWSSLKCSMCKSLQGLAGSSRACYREHACLFLFSRATTGRIFVSAFCTLNFQHIPLKNVVIFQVGKMGSGAIAISLPFSCVLGLLSSMTSSTMGRQFNNAV